MSDTYRAALRCRNCEATLTEDIVVGVTVDHGAPTICPVCRCAGTLGANPFGMAKLRALEAGGMADEQPMIRPADEKKHTWGGDRGAWGVLRGLL